jgi:hypothetical protein
MLHTPLYVKPYMNKSTMIKTEAEIYHYMVQLYKITTGIDVLDQDQLLPWNKGITRGHRRKLFKTRSKTNTRRNSFAQRVVDPWNSLPEDIVMAPSLNMFKSALNCVVWNETKFRPSC